MPKYERQKFKDVCSKGDYNQVVAYLASLDDGRDMLEKYKDIYENGAYFSEPEDERISDFLRRYEDYLKWALSNETATRECKERIVSKLKPLFPWVKFISRFSKNISWLSLQSAVNAYFKKKGYHVLFGVTPPYPDLYLWSKETTRRESVELPEGSVKIDVCEMDGIVLGGWLDYLSMSKTGTGGWVTKKGCAYFKRKYDTASDEFQISLLKHEGQHFFDMKKHPKMRSVDLEYRAKLVELIYCKDMKIFFSFLKGMADADDRTYPHPYAERKIIQALSRKIFGREPETCHDSWATKGGEIQMASLELLKEHSKKLVGWNGKSFIV